MRPVSGGYLTFYQDVVRAPSILHSMQQLRFLLPLAPPQNPPACPFLTITKTRAASGRDLNSGILIPSLVSRVTLGVSFHPYRPLVSSSPWDCEKLPERQLDLKGRDRTLELYSSGFSCIGRPCQLLAVTLGQTSHLPELQTAHV